MKSLTLPLLLLFLALVAPGARLHAADDKTREEAVIKFEHNWADAMIKPDLAALDRLETDDFVSVDPAGNIYNKAQDTSQYGPGKLKFEALQLSDLKVRFFGNTAVVTGIADSKARDDAQDISGKYRFTDVLVFSKGTWRAVSTQANRVLKP